MKLYELLKVINPEERIRITEKGKEIFRGYNDILDKTELMLIPIDTLEVETFSFRADVYSPFWKERKLISPVDPEKTPDFKFKDLDMSIIYDIKVR